MLNYLLYIFCYYASIVAFFVFIQRPIFIAYNNKTANPDKKLSLRDLWQIYCHGIHTDAITAVYLCAVPLLAGALHCYVPGFSLRLFTIIYTALISIVAGLISVADTALYKFWQYKIDKTVLTYLHSLKGAFASVTTIYIVVALLAVFTMSGIFFLMVISASLHSASLSFSASGLVDILLVTVAMLMMAGLFVIIMRGLGRWPNNPFMLSFHSKNLFYNHCSLNPVDSFAYSLTVKQSFNDEFRFFQPEECKRIVAPLFPTSGIPSIKLLNTDRPNVLFIVWESLCARFMEPLGGMPDVTPRLNAYAENEGILFTHVDAGSFRTDRGLVCLLSGYLAQPTTSIIRMTQKLPNLPAFPRVFKDMGYETTVVHGGDLNIFHKKAYYMTIGHDNVISQPDFSADSAKCKWGVHDGVTMERVYEDIMDKTKRGVQWFLTYQTLSSHDPYDVPYSRIQGDKIANSYAYVDDRLGDMLDRLKQSPAWDNLLVVVVGDHGCNWGEPLSRDKYPHIPIILLGGAVKGPRKIDTIMSQSDLAATLLGQLGLSHDNFTFSRDVLADTYTMPFSFHTYNNGFLFRDPTGFTVYDCATSMVFTNPDAEREAKGKAILQNLYDDLDQR